MTTVTPKRYPQPLKDATPGELRATCLEFAQALYHARIQANPYAGVSVSSPNAAWRTVRDIAHGQQERLIALYLNAQNEIIDRRTVSLGSLNTTRTTPREVFRPAVELSALAVILAHNHPSGCSDPSLEDVEFTDAIKRAGELLGIELYDHLIVTTSGYASLRERGLVA
jgi:DNA repair protein RadC